VEMVRGVRVTRVFVVRAGERVAPVVPLLTHDVLRRREGGERVHPRLADEGEEAVERPPPPALEEPRRLRGDLLLELGRLQRLRVHVPEAEGADGGGVVDEVEGGLGARRAGPEPAEDGAERERGEGEADGRHRGREGRGRRARKVRRAARRVAGVGAVERATAPAAPPPSVGARRERGPAGVPRRRALPAPRGPVAAQPSGPPAGGGPSATSAGARSAAGGSAPRAAPSSSRR